MKLRQALIEMSPSLELQRAAQAEIARQDELISELLEALRKCKTSALPSEVRDVVNNTVRKAVLAGWGQEGQA